MEFSGAELLSFIKDKCANLKFTKYTTDAANMTSDYILVNDEFVIEVLAKD